MPSKFFGSERPEHPHLVHPGGGVAGEVYDLRRDVETAFVRLEEALLNEMERLPLLAYAGVSLVNVVSAPGQGAVATLRLQDNSNRHLTLPATFNPSVSGSGGLDTGVESSSTFYYLYAVPVVGSLTALMIVGSISDPTVGPTGFSLWKYLGAVYNNSASNILPFVQSGNETRLASARTVLSLSGVLIATEVSPQAVSFADFVPKTASGALLLLGLKAQAAGNGLVELYVDGFESLPSHIQVQSSDTEWNFVTEQFPMPTVPKQLFRRFEEFSGDLDTFNLFCLGWVDSRL